MWSFLGYFLFGPLSLSIVKGICHINEDLYYRELGCQPQETDKDGCVTSYDCSVFSQRNQNQCYYQGQGYNRGQHLEPSPPCLANCRCGRTVEGKEKATFACANVECPELFQGPPQQGCYRTYEHGKCCFLHEICEGDAISKSPQTTCEFMGKIYKEGQRFYADEEPCMQCICQSGFNGSLVEPFCKKFQCDLELHYAEHLAKGCVPVYYGIKGCCPIEWRCPSKDDSVIAVNSRTKDGSSNKSGKTCLFGKLKMQIGDMLNSDNDEVKCVCQVPPQPLCVQQEDDVSESLSD